MTRAPLGLDPLFSGSRMRAALNGIRPATTPVWFMRQAGRSLPEYRALREGKSMLAACTTPEIAAEITLQPVRRHHVDAAVFFSDIVVPLYLAGANIDIVPGRGPVLKQPLTSAAEVEKLTELEVADWSVIEQAAAHVRRELPYEKVLLGFAGAPFTLASYLLEAGGPRRRECLETRAFIEAQPAAWTKLATWCAKLSGQFMKAQINGGAEAVQLFDSWAGALTAEEYRRIALPYSTLAFQGAPGATHIHFGVGTAHLIEAMGEIAEVVSVSSDLSLDAAARRLPGKVLQGNLDPDLLVPAEQPAQTDATPTDAKPTDHMEQIWREAEQVLQAGLAAPVHIFNLGHGVRPDTDPGVLTELTARIHAWRAPDTSPTENCKTPTNPTR